MKISDASLIRKYVFGTGTAEFYVCARCGVLTFAASRIDGREYAVVNVNTFEDAADVTLISRATDFEGETVAQRLARRKRTWIPNVVIRVDSGSAEISKPRP